MTDEPVKKSEAVARWFASEDFWKQVTVNVVSAAIVAVLTVIVAGLFGLLDWWWVLNLAFTVAVVIVLLLPFYPVLRWYLWRHRPHLVKRGVEGVAIARVLDVVVFTGGGMVYVALVILVLWLASLIGVGVKIEWTGFLWT